MSCTHWCVVHSRLDAVTSAQTEPGAFPLYSESPPLAGRAWRAVYGTADGRWFVLAGPPEHAPPAHVDGAPYLGAPCMVVQAAYEDRRKRAAEDRHRQVAENERRRAAGGEPEPLMSASPQRELAELLLVSQQSVSRYVTGVSPPDLSLDGWRHLVAEAIRLGGMAARSL